MITVQEDDVNKAKIKLYHFENGEKIRKAKNKLFTIWKWRKHEHEPRLQDALICHFKIVMNTI